MNIYGWPWPAYLIAAFALPVGVGLLLQAILGAWAW